MENNLNNGNTLNLVKTGGVCLDKKIYKSRQISLISAFELWFQYKLQALKTLEYKVQKQP
jgi:hypothetical protein